MLLEKPRHAPEIIGSARTAHQSHCLHSTTQYVATRRNPPAYEVEQLVRGVYSTFSNLAVVRLSRGFYTTHENNSDDNVMIRVRGF